MKARWSTGSTRSMRLVAMFTTLFLMHIPARVCVADVDMTGTWYMGISPGQVVALAVTQTGTQIQAGTGQGTIDPMTGNFTITFMPTPPDCGATFSGQVAGDTFIAPGLVGYTDPNCHSIFCACGATAPSELRGSRAPCGNGALDGGEACDDGQLGFGGSCCALGCTVRPAGETCTPDGNDCTDDLCDGNATCTHTAVANGTSCDDGQFCNGQETDCQAGVCTTGAAPCPLACDEGTDQCVTSCPDSPQTCRTAEKSLFALKLSSDPNKNKLLWKWIKGTSTTQAEFSDPTTPADYALCIYNPFYPPLQTIIPAGSSAWQATGTLGYRYNDPTGAANSINRIQLKGSTSNRSGIVTKGRGTQLPLISLPSVFPVKVQLYSGRTGMCWGVEYSVEQLIKNDPTYLKAKTP